LVLAAGAAVVVLTVVAGPTILDNLGGLFGPQPGGPGPSSGEPQVWDPAFEFRDSPNEANPSPDRYGNDGVWSYLRSASDAHDPATYSLLPDFEVVNGNAMIWYEAQLFSLQVRHMTDLDNIYFHPWSDGDRSYNHHAILAWQSPVTGLVTVTGIVVHEEPTCVAGRTDGTTLFVDKESTTVQSITLRPGGRGAVSATIDIRAGESIYFVVDPGYASNCDTTYLHVQISH